MCSVQKTRRESIARTTHTLCRSLDTRGCGEALSAAGDKAKEEPREANNIVTYFAKLHSHADP